MKLQAKWTDDCQGKKDYDGPIIEISSRYWPRGGGFHVSHGGSWEGNETRPHILPCARASLIIRHGESDYAVLTHSGYIECETEEEVKEKVEKWAQEKMDEVVAALIKIYGEPGKE